MCMKIIYAYYDKIYRVGGEVKRVVAVVFGPMASAESRNLCVYVSPCMDTYPYVSLYIHVWYFHEFYNSIYFPILQQ